MKCCPFLQFGQNLLQKFLFIPSIINDFAALPVDSVIHEFNATDLDSDAELKFQILTTTAKDMIGTPLQVEIKFKFWPSWN